VCWTGGWSRRDASTNSGAALTKELNLDRVLASLEERAQLERARDLEDMISVTATTAPQLVGANAVRAAPNDQTALEQQVLSWFADIAAADPEVLATLEWSANVDVERTGKQTLARRALENVR
jgi:hypothetical protein